MGEETNSAALGRSVLLAAMVLWTSPALLHLAEARAQTPVSIELVLAVDTSRSVDGFEYDLLMSGIAQAFRRPEIIDLIGQQDGVAVTLFQWNTEVDERYVIPWHLLTGPESVAAFAARVERVKRDPYRGFTAIGNAIDFGIRLIAENAFRGRRMKIDVSGDGRSNNGPDPSLPRRQAKALGIVINGLPILTQNYEASFYDLKAYYREQVIVGPGAFIEVADDYGDFARAFRHKLLRELNPLFSRNDADPPALDRPGFVQSGRVARAAAALPVTGRKRHRTRPAGPAR